MSFSNHHKELVKNGDFDDFKQCDNAFATGHSVDDWQKIRNAQHHHPSCSNSYLRYFDNIDSTINLGGLMALKLYETNTGRTMRNMVTDAISSKLKKTLKKGRFYKIEVTLALSKKSKYASDELYIWFEPVDKVADFKEQVVNINLEQLTMNPEKWFKFELVYETKNKERQINIGIAPFTTPNYAKVQSNAEESELENNALYFVGGVSMVESR